MEIVADLLMTAGTLGAAFYCVVLSRKLSRFNALEDGMGGAVAVLSVQVDELTKALEMAQATSMNSSSSLEELIDRAKAAEKQLELTLAAIDDIQEQTHLPPANARERAVRRTRRNGSAARVEEF